MMSNANVAVFLWTSMEWAELHERPGDDRRPQEMTVVWIRLFGFSIVDV